MMQMTVAITCCCLIEDTQRIFAHMQRSHKARLYRSMPVER